MLITSQIAPHVLGGKLALVTGAGQGNGRAIARGLAKAGAKVVVTTPQNFAQSVDRRYGSSIAHHANRRMADVAPWLSAEKLFGRMSIVLAAVLVLLFGVAVFAIPEVWNLFALHGAKINISQIYPSAGYKFIFKSAFTVYRKARTSYFPGQFIYLVV